MQYDDERIDALVRAMRRHQEEPAAQIPAEVVHAYVTGRASAQQKSEVRRALVRSPQFREELIQLAHYLETLSSEEAAAAFAKAEAPAFVPREVPSESRARPARAEGQSLWERVVAATSQLFTVPRLLVAAPAMAAAVLLVTMLPRVSWSPIVVPSYSTSVDAARFARPPGLPRGEGEVDHEQAALRGLHQCLRTRDGRLEIIPLPPRPTAWQRVATVHLVDKWRRKLKTLDVTLPEEAFSPTQAPRSRAESSGGASSAAQIWIAALPDAADAPVSVRAFPLPVGKSMTLRWDSQGNRRGLLLVTFESEGGYHASPCIAFAVGSE